MKTRTFVCLVLWLASAGCNTHLDPTEPVTAALAADLRSLATLCGEGDFGDSEIEGFPAFSSDRDFLDGRARVTEKDGDYSLAATFDNGVTITSSIGIGRFDHDFRPSDTVVTWPTPDGGRRRVCGSASSVVGVRVRTNTPFLFLVDVIGEGDDCVQPLSGRIRICL